MRTRRIVLIVAIVVVVLLVVAASTIFVFTNTDWGREKTRRFALGAVAGSAHGIVKIGKIDGNLLTGATLRGVSITDSAGEPFIKVDEVHARYSIASFISKKIYLDNVTLMHPVIVLNRKPGEKWNYDLIFPRDTTHKGPSAPGFGSWIKLTDVTVLDGDLTARLPWKPDSTLTKRQQDSVIAFNLGTQGRLNIVRVPGGFQQISQFHQINGKLPSLRIADPGDKSQVYDVATLRAIAEPFRPPVVTVTDLRGRFTVLGDSLYFNDVNAALAASKLSGVSGRYNIANNDLRLRLHADPVATNDLLWIDPAIPQNGTGALDFGMDWVGTNSDYAARNARLQVAGASIAGKLGLLVNDTSMTFHDTDLHFTRLDTRTIAQLFPTLKSPRQGYLTGRAAVAGPMTRMALDADVTFDDPISGRSRVLAVGGVGFPKVGVFTNDLKLTLEPVQVGLARIAMPKLPVGGTITGTARLNGLTTERLAVQADLVHHDVTGPSHITGTAAYAPGRVPFVNADLRLHPLSLATVGRFAPAAGLHGTLTGPVKLSGPMRDLTLAADLTTPDGGSVTADGHANFAAKTPSYDVAVATHLFNANLVSEKAPRTNLTLNALARGSGTTPETVNATLAADVKTSRYDSLTVDSAKIRVSAANGMLHVDTLAARVPHGAVNAQGTLGLTKTTTGELRYTVEVDSLGALSLLLPPPDTTTIRPRPGILAERMQRVREDSARAAQATEIERAISGAPAPKLAPVDTPATIPGAKLAGAVDAEGVLRGNIHAFNAEGTASATNLVAYGNSANTVSARYDVRNVLTPQMDARASIRAGGVLASGFSIDSLVGSGTYQKPRGTVDLSIRQSNNRIYNANAAFVLNKDRNDLLLNNLRLQFDSTLYTSARPSLIHFGPAGVDVDSFDIRGNRNGSRVFVDGRVPTSGTADMRFDVTNFEVGNILTLLESDLPARGLVSLDGAMTGTSANPSIRAAFGASRVTYRGAKVPEVHGLMNYTDQTLHADVKANMEGERPLLAATGTVPVNLAISGVTGSRVPTGRAIDVKIDSDSLPLDKLPQVSDAVSNLGGSAIMHAHVTGTVEKPDATGQFVLNSARAKIVPAGVTVSGINGNVLLQHQKVTIDSLVARSGGPIRVTGGVDLTTLTKPVLDMRVVASNAKVLDNDMGNMKIDAIVSAEGQLDSLTVGGSVRLLSGVIEIPEPTGKTVIGAGDPAVFSVLDTAVASNKLLFPTESALMKNLSANVDVSIDPDVFVRSREANVEIYTEEGFPVHLTLDQRRNRMVIDGAVITDRGEYRFQGRQFVIRHGSATFINTPQLNPTLQVTGEYVVQLPAREALTIRILISGTLDNPKISLESDAQPPIAQTDLLSYLAFGRSSTSLLQQEGSGLATGGAGSSNIVGSAAALAQQQVAGAAIGAVTDQVAGEAARSLGADVLNITPADVSTDVGNFLRATQVEFGKYIYTRTFLGLQFRLDPASLQRPGFQLEHAFDSRRRYSIQASLEPRYLVREPSLSTDQDPATTSVFGLFLIRDWRY